MNILRDFLAANRERLEPERYGVAGGNPFVLLTPRFAASRHVVFLVLTRGSSTPTLVAKIPRVRGDSSGIEREASVLEKIEELAPSQVGAVPRVLACEEFRGHVILLETALIGRPMDPDFVRRSPARATQFVLTWLSGLGVGEPPPATRTGAFERLLREPLRSFSERFERADSEPGLIDETLEIVRPLERDVRQVIEHGDVSHPNLFWLGDGRIGVIDWELAEVGGLPLHDLFFFLSYVASARMQARTVTERVTASHEAFFGRDPWAWPHVDSYCRRLGISRSKITPLFVACWARYAVGCLPRILGVAPTDSDANLVLAPEEKAVLRAHPYYALWRHALSHVDELGILTRN
jgi:aminoglycoside phosphotransferase